MRIFDTRHRRRRSSRLSIAALLATLVPATPAGADGPVAFTDEAAFLAELATRGDCVVVEGFEDEAAWEAVRSTVAGGNQTAESVTSRGVTWLPNSAASQVTTGGGAARDGAWGFYELPHGDFGSGIGDGFAATSEPGFTAAGGWIRTNTPYARIALVLDDSIVVDFESVQLGTAHLFFGVIAPAGFHRFEVRELEGVLEDQKFVFADDFTLGFAPTCPGHLFADGFESGGMGAWSVREL